MTKYILIMKDEDGTTWAADDFYTVTDAMNEATAKADAKGWQLVEIKPYQD